MRQFVDRAIVSEFAHPPVVRLLAPLTIPDAVLDEGLTMLSAAVRDACGRESTRAVAYCLKLTVIPIVLGRNVKLFCCTEDGTADAFV
jgi:hypothetical protein